MHEKAVSTDTNLICCCGSFNVPIFHSQVLFTRYWYKLEHCPFFFQHQNPMEKRKTFDIIILGLRILDLNITVLHDQRRVARKQVFCLLTRVKSSNPQTSSRVKGNRHHPFDTLGARTQLKARQNAASESLLPLTVPKSSVVMDQ